MTIDELRPRLEEYYRPKRPKNVYISLSLLQFKAEQVTDGLLGNYANDVCEDYYPLRVRLEKYKPQVLDTSKQDKEQLLRMFPDMVFQESSSMYVEGKSPAWRANYQKHTTYRSLTLNLDEHIRLNGWAGSDKPELSWAELAVRVRKQLMELRDKVTDQLEYLEVVCE